MALHHHFVDQPSLVVLDTQIVPHVLTLSLVKSQGLEIVMEMDLF